MGRPPRGGVTIKYGETVAPTVRRFVIVGHKATTSPDFSLKDIPGTSGRLDVLLRAVRSTLLVSHGLRQDTELFLVLLGGPNAPLTLKFRGEQLRNLNPDERSTATLVQKALSTPPTGPVWQPTTPGLEVAAIDLPELLDQVSGDHLFVLDENGEDVRGSAIETRDVTFLVGDHTGFTRDELALAEKMGARRVSVGPVSLHADDAIAVVQNELDRRKL